MANLDFNNLTPPNGAVSELSQLLLLETLGVDRLGSIFNILTKQQHGKKVGMVGEFGMVGSAGTGCNPVYGNSILAASEKTWDIKEWEVAESICYKDLEGTLAQVALRTKTKVADLTGTEYVDEILYPRLEQAIMKMLLRLAWFGDKDAKNIADGGVLSEGVDKKYFNVADGFWKRFFAIVAANEKRHTTIAANNAGTTATQFSELFAPGVATGIMDKLIYGAPRLLRQAENQVIYITQSLKDALENDITKNNKGSELQWKSIFGGIEETTYKSKKVIVISFWDEIIETCESIGTKLNKPHRAVYTTISNLIVGSESENEIAMIDIFFDQKDQKNYILAKDTIGTMTAQDDLLQVAY